MNKILNKLILGLVFFGNIIQCSNILNIIKPGNFLNTIKCLANFNKANFSNSEKVNKKFFQLLYHETPTTLNMETHLRANFYGNFVIGNKLNYFQVVAEPLDIYSESYDDNCKGDRTGEYNFVELKLRINCANLEEFDNLLKYLDSDKNNVQNIFNEIFAIYREIYKDENFKFINIVREIDFIKHKDVKRELEKKFGAIHNDFFKNGWGLLSRVNFINNCNPKNYKIKVHEQNNELDTNYVDINFFCHYED